MNLCSFWESELVRFMCKQLMINWTILFAALAVMLAGHKSLQSFPEVQSFWGNVCTMSLDEPPWGKSGSGFRGSSQTWALLIHSAVTTDPRRRLQLSICPCIRMRGHMASHTATPTTHTVPLCLHLSISFSISASFFKYLSLTTVRWKYFLLMTGVCFILKVWSIQSEKEGWVFFGL